MRSSGTGSSSSSARTPSAAHVIATRSESPASWNSGSVGSQRAELDVAVGQDEHAPALDAAVHAPGHLQDLVGAEVLLREHVAPAIDDVEELHVVDDHRVEPAHVERALARRGHREEVRLLLAALEKRAG